MATIFTIQRQFEIFIPDNLIIENETDNYISIEFPKGFNWHHHAAYNCVNCKALLNSFGTRTYKWLLQYENKQMLLDISEFGSLDDHFLNVSQFEISKAFYGTRLKFKTRQPDPTLLKAFQIFHEAEENYEMCKELADILKYIKDSNNS